MIDQHRGRFGVEPICRVLEVPTSTYYAAKQRPPSARRLRDTQLKAEIRRVWDDNYQVYGAARSGGSSSAKASRLPAAPWSG